MLDALKEKLVATLTYEALKNTYGNRAAIEQERRSFYAEVVGRLFPALEEAVEDEIAVVARMVVAAEQSLVVAHENAALAHEQVRVANQAVQTAHTHAVDAKESVRRAEANLSDAKAEFTKLVEKSRG
jgi:hypothetical protein